MGGHRVGQCGGGRGWEGQGLDKEGLDFGDGESCFFSWRCIWILDRALGSRRFDGAGGLAVDGILLTVGIERYRTALDADVVVVVVWAKKREWIVIFDSTG